MRLPSPNVLELLHAGVVIPAHPLALDAHRRLDERHQRALTRYYLAAGAGGVAVGVHTTQFAIRDPQHDLLRPVLTLAVEEVDRFTQRSGRPVIRIAGICGRSDQAVTEAALARELGYDVGLLSLAALQDAHIDELIKHARIVGQVMPLMGFYLQPAVGGRVLPYEFWRAFCEIESVIAIKIAPFNRYQTLDVLRGVLDSGRAGHIALYTGNDDNILTDLLTTFRLSGATPAREPLAQEPPTPDPLVRAHGNPLVRESLLAPTLAGFTSRESARAGETNSIGDALRIVGGLLGHWAVWTHCAVEHLALAHEVSAGRQPLDSGLLTLAAQITDANAALFDAANHFAGCIAGVQEVLRSQGLLATRYCLDPREDLSPGQHEAIQRVRAAYPHLLDDDFIDAHRDEWLC